MVDVEATKSIVHSKLIESAQMGFALEREHLCELVYEVAPLTESHELKEIIDLLVADMSGLGRLQLLVEDQSITELMVNGSGEVWIERKGHLELTSTRVSSDEVMMIIERIVGPLGLRIDRSSPIVDARMLDGSRVNAVIPPLSVDGPCLTIRRFGVRSIGLDEFGASEPMQLLADAVANRMNILVSGATGAGKTTLLNALSSHIPMSERLITVEDAAELRLSHPHVVRLEARPANAEGIGKVTVRDLVRNALRMRPDRIIVGEFRGQEAFDMLQAMNTGHEGSMSTCHANSPADALRRLESMVLMANVGLPISAIRDQIASTVDLVVQVGRSHDGVRSVISVCEVVDSSSQVGLESQFAKRLIQVADGRRLLAPMSRPYRSNLGTVMA